MRYLTSALVSEGSTDDRFLPRLLGRAMTDLCLTNFANTVDVADVQPLRARRGPSSVDEVLDLVDRNAASFLLIFFHRDCGPNADRVEQQWLAPIRQRWGDRRERLVPVVPVRETEAWLLADGDALRNAFGVRSWSDADLGLPPRPRDVETIPEPKRVLNDIVARVSRSAHDHFEQLGEMVSLERLGQVPAYQPMEG